MFSIYIYIYMDIYIYIIWIYVYIIYMWSCRRVIMVYQYKWPFTPTLWAIHLLMDDSNPSIGVSNSYLFQPLDRCDKPLDVARHMALLYTVCTICTIYIYIYTYYNKHILEYNIYVKYIVQYIIQYKIYVYNIYIYMIYIYTYNIININIYINIVYII